jgi:hypothetical protein
MTDMAPWITQRKPSLPCSEWTKVFVAVSIIIGLSNRFSHTHTNRIRQGKRDLVPIGDHLQTTGKV